MKRHSAVLRLCVTAMLAALFYVLGLVTIRTPITNITFASLPIVVGSILFGPVVGAGAGLIGELIQQLLSYGFTATTVLWILPPVMRGLIVGIGAWMFVKKGKRIENSFIPCYIWCMCAAVVTTLLNTVTQFIDCKVYHYPMPYAWASLPTRFIIGIVMSVIITSISIPVCRILRKYVSKMDK